MYRNSRYTIKIAGASGLGINSVGEILGRALKSSGFKIFGYREYPSLIKGGIASYQIDFSDSDVRSPSALCDLMLCFDRSCFYSYLRSVKANGIIIHTLSSLALHPEDRAYIEQNSITLCYVNAQQHVLLQGGKPIMANILMLGTIWRALQFELGPLESACRDELGGKKELLSLNLKCLQHGYTLESATVDKSGLPQPWSYEVKDISYMMSGNHALSLGAIAAGVRAYYAYPMTPSSSILEYLAEQFDTTKMLVRQVEDEITAAQMVLGSMSMGTRSFTATSGGGFDLMSESLSMAGIAEIPFVCVLGQRPGPATGLPTWTAAGDLNLALYAGHGEFPRCVIAASDPQSAYLRVQEAFNIAEQFQIPVILLTDKQIAESLFQVWDLPAPIAIERGLVDKAEFDQLEKGDRYKFSESGISPRWLPGQSDATYVINSDEHSMDGSSIEDADTAQAMMEKRMKKLNKLSEELPEPELFGDERSDITFIGWGSVKNTVLDAIDTVAASGNKTKVNYLHYEYLYPFKVRKLKEVLMKGRKVVLIENNYTGQLGELIVKEAGIKIEKKLLKYDGRPFFLDDILQYIYSAKT